MNDTNKTANYLSQEKWIIDTDPGVDDSFAIILAITFLKENIIALSIVNGNVGIEGCFINAKKICAIKDFFIPIYKGSYLNFSGVNLNAAHFHGKDGLLELEDFHNFDKIYDEKLSKQNHQNSLNPLIEKYSPLKIIELSYKHPNALNILAIGPLTNLAAAIMLDPTLPQRINKLVIMGGSYSSLGNIKSNVEFNFACDPIAAKKVFNSFNHPNNQIILYPWETCKEHLIEKNQLELIGKFSSTTKKFCESIINKKVSLGGEGIFADFGSAVYITNEKSIRKSIKKYVDISIDAFDCNFGQICLESDYAVKDANKRKKVEIITLLDEDIYYDCFTRMNEI